MPELPEVETIKNMLKPDLVNRKITRTKAYRKNLRFDIDDFTSLWGEVVLDVKRRGKYLLIETKKGDIIIHLGMTGFLRWVDKNPEKHDHFEIILDNGKILRLKDPRRFGMVLFQDKNTPHELLQNMGYEPLDNSFTWQKLKNKLENKTVAIKKGIMDGNIVVGVGNIYASEALFHAKIKPKRPCNKIKDNEWKALHKSIQYVLNEGIRLGGSSIRDYHHPDGKSGDFIDTVYVYGKKGDKCKVCKGQIQGEMINGRNTFWCDNCQT